MASPVNFPFPPPSRRPPPPPPPTPSAPNNSNTTVIVLGFVSFGGLLLLAFVAAALCCYIWNTKNKKKTVREADRIRFDEHRKVKEAIVDGPRGPKSVVLEIEDDVHLDENIRKNEKVGDGRGHGQHHHLHHGAEMLHGKSENQQGNPRTIAIEGGDSSTSGSEHHRQLQHKA